MIFPVNNFYDNSIQLSNLCTVFVYFMFILFIIFASLAERLIFANQNGYSAPNIWNMCNGYATRKVRAISAIGIWNVPNCLT